MQTTEEDYKKSLQQVKAIIFQTLLDKNNNWMTKKEIENSFKQKGETDPHIKMIQDAIESSLYHYYEKDEYKLTTDSDPSQTKQQLTNQTRYRLKTENITNKEQLIEFLRGKKSIINVNPNWFESCYPDMSKDLNHLISESKLLVSQRRQDKKKQYIYIDSVFKNYQEKIIFKDDPFIKQMILDAKSSNLSTIYQEQQNSLNQQQKPETSRKTNTIQNSWIEGLQQELQKR